jgi:DNA-entry nuclease
MKQMKLLTLLLCVLLTLSACGETAASSSSVEQTSAPAESASVSAEASEQTEEEELETVEAETSQAAETPVESTESSGETITMDSIPAYSGSAYVAVNDNQPFFTESDYTTEAFETYSNLDSLGRCGVAYANICTELMPTEKRGEIGQVKPSGWHTVKYDCVDGKYLYNRCHLIGYQLAGENANEKNLITGTRYLNIQGMLPFENMVADYVKETENHVLYRITPVFTGNNLVADGVLMEGYSVEDSGDGVCFCVFAYNVQPGVTIDYATGDSALSGDTTTEAQETTTTTEETTTTTASSGEMEYVLNTNSHKFHDPSCSSVDSISAANRQDYTGTRESVIAMGYEPCGRCKP